MGSFGGHVTAPVFAGGGPLPHGRRHPVEDQHRVGADVCHGPTAPSVKASAYRRTVAMGSFDAAMVHLGVSCLPTHGACAFEACCTPMTLVDR